MNKRNYQLLVFFLLFLIAIVAYELITGCAISFSKPPNVSGFTCKEDNLSGYIVNLVFQAFIVLITLIMTLVARAKKNYNK